MGLGRKATWPRLGEDHRSSGVPWFGGHTGPHTWYLQNHLAENRTWKPACEVEVWARVLLMCSQFACILLVIALGLGVWANRGCSVFAPGGSPLHRIRVDWAAYSH